MSERFSEETRLTLSLSNMPPPLSWSQADELQKKYGKNIISSQKPIPWYTLLIGGILHPFNFVLAGLAIVAGATQDWRTMSVMLTMILISVCLRFFQELKSESKAQSLKQMVQNKVTVIRLSPLPQDHEPTDEDIRTSLELGGVKQEIFLEDVVPGDLVFICAGDMIPGDIELLNSKDLYVSQAALTGEALPVEKYPTYEPQLPKEEKVEDKINKPNFCFMGTSVVSGTATALVLNIGPDTVFGEMATKLAAHRPQNAFEKGVKRVSYMFVGIMACMIPSVLIISGFIQGNWFQAFLFTVAVAVGLTPEMLPMIVNSCLAKSAVVMSKKKMIIKRLDSIINLGTMDVLCTDKTGTLTQNKVVLIKHINAHGEESNVPLSMAFLNAYFQTGLKNLLDVAIINYYEQNKDKHEDDLTEKFEKIDEIPFDFMRRRMSVIVRNKKTGEQFLVSKGAVDETVGICVSKMIVEGKIEKLGKKQKQKIKDLAEELSSDGLRAVAVGFKKLRDDHKDLTVKDECDLTFLGYVAFLDPPKESAAEAIVNLMELGVEVKVLTGDSPTVCNKVCQQLNLPVKGIVTTTDLENLDENELLKIAEESTIFARLTPLQKADIVRVLKKKHTIGFMGDGINDAVALHDADVGISVDEAVDVAKESAHIILLEKSLLVITKGIVEGRKTYCNAIKYIKMAVSSNFGNVFSVLIASAWLPFLPMKPIHIVLQNLLYDISQLAIPWDSVDMEFKRNPPKPFQTRSILRFMVCLGPISSIFDMTTFSFMWYYYNIQTPLDDVTLFQTAWFVEGLLTQTLIIHMIRTPKIPFFQSTASKSVIIGTSLAILIALGVPFTPLNLPFNMVPYPTLYFLYLLGVVFTYAIITNIGKQVYVRIFGDWL